MIHIARSGVTSQYGVRRRRQGLVAALLLLFAFGCAPEIEPDAQPPADDTVETALPSNNDEIGIIAGGGGAATPVTNSDSVTGAGGGGVGVAAKSKAKEVAAEASERARQGEELADIE